MGARVVTVTELKEILLETGFATRLDAQMYKLSRERGVPTDILALVKAPPKKVADAYRSANDAQYWEFVKTRKTVELLGRPLGITVVERDDRITLWLQFKTVKVAVELDRAEYEGRTAEEWARAASEWWLVRAERVTVKSKKREKEFTMWKAAKWKVLAASEDVEAFKRLEEKLGSRMKAVYAAAGYDFDRLSEGARILILTRLLHLASDLPIYAVELTVPRTGKTTFALRLKYMARWEYFSKPPTLATLAGDARTGKSMIPRLDGIWFDEVDKWFIKRANIDKLADAMEVLLTGMAQGHWSREAGGVKRPESGKLIHLRFSGNISGVASPRDWLKARMVEALGAGVANAFMDRIGVAVCAGTDDYAREIDAAVVRGVIPRAAALRGMIKVLRDEFWTRIGDYVNDYDTRSDRQKYAIAAAVASIFNDGDASTWLDIAEKLSDVSDPKALAQKLRAELENSSDSP